MYIYIYIYTHTHTHTHIYIYTIAAKHQVQNSSNCSKNCTWLRWQVFYMKKIKVKQLLHFFDCDCSWSIWSIYSFCEAVYLVLWLFTVEIALGKKLSLSLFVRDLHSMIRKTHFSAKQLDGVWKFLQICSQASSVNTSTKGDSKVHWSQMWAC